MSDLWVAVALMPVAYLLGTFPSAGLVARRAGVDVTREGSGNPGASNVFRVLGWKAGVLVFVADCAKGAAAAGAGLAIDGHRGGFLLGGAAIAGHMWPITRRCKGGRGVATGAGVILVMFPLLTLAIAALWGVTVLVTRKASLASLSAAIVFPIAVVVAGRGTLDIVVVAALCFLVVLRHASNVRRLLRGEEHDVAARAGDRGKPAAGGLRGGG